MKFVSLHSHTTFSYGDGFGMPEEHVARIADLGMGALALTEHGNTTSHVKLEQAAKKHGIKPIFGLEAYTGPASSMRKWHMTMLAATQDGYRNLTQLTTRSWSEGFYRWPTVHWDMVEQHHDGIIFTSGCADSHLACTLLGGKGIETGDERAARQVMLRYRDLFGDRFYLETQRFPQLERCKQINEKYEEWSRKYKIPLVGTADVHYPFAGQNDLQQALHAANRGHTVGDSDWNYDVRLTYPVTDKEMIADLRETGLSKRGAEQALSTSSEIAERCNVALPVMERVQYPITDKDFEPWGKPKQKSFSGTGATKAGSTAPSVRKRRKSASATQLGSNTK